MRLKKALTYVEALVAMAVVALIASLLFPVFVNIRSRILESTCTSNLRQIHSAAMLYRAEHDGDGKYGSPEEMGLPFWMDQLEDAGYLPPDSGVFRCTAPASAIDPASPALYMSLWLTAGWREYCQQYKDDSILLADVNHNPPTRPLRSPYVQHHCIGLYLGGQVLTLHKTGRPMDPNWWSEP